MEALRLHPRRKDLLDLLATLPEPLLKPGSRAGDRLVLPVQGIELPLRWCPPGKFRMGSPKSERDRCDNEDLVDVELTRGYWLGETEVTQALCQAVIGTNPSHFKVPRRPVENVSWDDACQFCEKLTAVLREDGTHDDDSDFRLPTEAEWEYACRAGTRTAYSFGDDAKQLFEYAWFGGNSGKETHDVATLKPNAWGLHDMHGNVWEWCQDWYGEKLPGGRDPLVSSGGSDRVYRGGGWFGTAGRCRSAFRGRFVPSFRGSSLGFRCVLSPSGE